MSKGRIFLWLCLSFIGGIFVSSFISISQGILWGFLLLGIISAIVWRRDKRFVVFGCCIVLAVFGAYHYQDKIQKTSQLVQYRDAGEVVIRGVISREPEVRTKSTVLIIEGKEIEIHDRKVFFSGTLLAITERYPEYRYGDELKIYGELKTPEEDLNGFNYKEHLAKDGIYSVMYFPEIEKAFKNTGNPIITALLLFKHKLTETILTALPAPTGELLVAILLGDEHLLSEEIVEDFNLSGTRHIMAISGMNITIISKIILGFFLAIALSRKQAFVVTVFILSLFIIMVGAPASVIRAGAMAGVFLFAQNIGRPKSEVRAITYAALIMLLFNPLLLRLDIGFQLSFLAILGIIYFSEYIKKYFSLFPEAFGVREAAASTIAAQLTTLPILVYNFGKISLVSFPANILVVPTLPFLMIGGFVGGLGGMVLEEISRMVLWPAWIALKHILLIVDFFSNLKFASLTLENISWAWMIPYYAILFWFWNSRVRKWSRDALI